MPGDAEHVRELVRVADRGGRAAREHGALEALRDEQRALEMDVRVDEAGTTCAPFASISRVPWRPGARPTTKPSLIATSPSTNAHVNTSR